MRKPGFNYETGLSHFLSVVIILPGELLQTDKHQHKYHNLCKFQGR